MKIGFLITARLKSSRLPFKVLKMLNDRVVIEHIIERAKHINDISEIVVCTSDNPQDKPLADISLKSGVYCFNGSEDDVMNRLLGAAKFYGLDYFVGITADNPLFSVYHSNLIVDEIKRSGGDFIKVNGLPLGCATYGMSVKALETVCKVKTVIDTEIWGRLIDRPNIFDVRTIEADPFYQQADYRLTLDYIEDYKVFHSIYNNVSYIKYIDLFSAVQYLNQNPKISNINSNCKQLDLDKKTIEKIDLCFEENIDEITRLKDSIYKEMK